MPRRSVLVVAGLASLIIVAYLAYDLLKGVVSPCEAIFEQTSVRLGTKLDVLQTKGELHLGREKVQDLTEAAQMTALNLKTCCIVLDKDGVDSSEFLQCKNAAQDYEAKIDTVVSRVEDASSAKEAGDTAAYEQTLSRIDEALGQARQASKMLEDKVSAIVEGEESGETQGIDQGSTADAEPAGDAVDQAIGELTLTWDGKTQTYWNILQADATGDYSKVAQTGWLQKGQTQVVELAPGDYRVDMSWDRGFEPQDVTVASGKNVAIRPVFGTISFTWDGRTQAYWNILQPDAFGDYHQVEQTGQLQKSQTQVVELAPGDYRVDMSWDRGFEPQDVTVETGKNVAIGPVFGTIAFTWDGRTQAYWNILQADTFGDYHQVEQTGQLQKGQTQVVELAPGDYRVDMSWDRGFEPQDVTVATGKNVAIRPVFGTAAFTWDGRTQAYWNILQADAFGDYHEVAETGWLQKGQTQVVELAPGDYRVDMHWDQGFEPEDVSIEAGKSVAVGPAFGTITFRWDGADQTYWDILQMDSFGDTFEVAETGWLQDGQEQVVELAPGAYWVRRHAEDPEDRKVTVEIDSDALVTE